MTKPKLVFFGSGPVAAKSLELLLENFEIEAVITKPVTLKEMADILPGCPIFSANTKAELDDLILREKFQSQLGILIDFGIMVSDPAINYFPLGIVNSHFSILPEWRGADPITFSILSGQDITGVSLMLISSGLDEGLILAIAELPIENNDTTPSLTDKLINLSNTLLISTLPDYIAGKVDGINQEKASELMGKPYNPTYSRKLTKSDGSIDWNKPAEVIMREIRAYTGWPRSYATINGINLIIHKAEQIDRSGKPGEYEFTKKSLIVFCGTKALDIKIVQPSGKKEMPIQAFLAGYNL